MAKGTMDFAQQNTEQAMQATNWMRAVAEQNLNQSRGAYEGLLTIARDAVGGVEAVACRGGIDRHYDLRDGHEFALPAARDQRAVGPVLDDDLGYAEGLQPRDRRLRARVAP